MDEGFLKLRQLYAALHCQPSLNEKYVESILQQEGDVNYQLPANSVLASSNPEITGTTALHLAHKNGRIQIFNLLLNYGADCSIKNREGSTVLHQIIEDACGNLQSLAKNPFFAAAIEACTNPKSFANPTNKYGVSHFHAACIANKTAFVKLALQNGKILVDQSVSASSPIFPGYTALHFSVECCNVQTTKILLKSGANVNVKNARRLTALQMVIERKVKTSNELPDDRKLVQLLLAAHDFNKEAGVVDGCDGLSLLHVACTMTSVTMLERILEVTQNVDQLVNSNSPIFPGSAALHFAATCNLDAVKLLTARGADVLLKNSSGQTALDLCIERYEVKVVHDVLSTQQRFHDVLLSNGASLLDLILAFDGPDPYGFCAQRDLAREIHVSIDSPLWPGYSILHVATMFAEKKRLIIERLLHYNTIDCSVRPRDETPLHLAFRLEKAAAVDAMMSRPSRVVHSDAVSRDGLTHLHIACATKNAKVAEDLLALPGTEVNGQLRADYRWGDLVIPRGSTALHVAVMVESCELARLLLDKGASLYVKDANGMTPVHWLLMSSSCSMPIVDLLLTPSEDPSPAKKRKKNKEPEIVSPAARKRVKLSPNTEALVESCADNGLTHLHVASYFGKVIAVEKLLQAKPAVDAKINDDEKLPGLVGCTPLNLAMKRQHQDVVHLLIRHGADVLLAKPDGSNPLLDALIDLPKYHANAFVRTVGGSRELQNRMYDSVGLTMLHLNCYVVNVAEVERSLNRNELVNRTVRPDSTVWPGFTPLHALVKHYEANSPAARALLQLLLSRGADVTMPNADGFTPLHLAYYLDINASEKVHLTSSLMQHHGVFKLNPADKNGLSHFHIACALADVGAIKEFLKRGVDANQPVRHCIRDGKLAGCTGLHLLLNQSLNRETKLEAIDVLIEHGADVHAENSRGNTPLHLAVKCDPWYMDLMRKLLDAGARIDARNMMGQTAFEILLNSISVSAEDVEFFLQCGYKINDFNPITHKGYMAITFSKYMNADVKKSILETMFDAPCVGEVDRMGRNAIHNIVSTSRQMMKEVEYADTIGKLLRVGCDIDHQDKLGRTPLHIATQFRNHRGIVALLNAGADINVIDADDKTAFAYSMEPSCLFEGSQDNSKQIAQTFANHVQKLNLCILTVHEVNQRTSAEALTAYGIDVNISTKFYEELKLTKTYKIEGTSLTLLDFISEKNAVRRYSSLPGSQRLAIDRYMESIDATPLLELIGIIRLQYRKALASQRLVEV